MKKSALHQKIFLFTTVFLLLAFMSDLGAQRRGRGEKPRDDNAPKVGEMAPTFTLKSLDGKEETNLQSFRGKKPVVLIFGSYT